MMIAMMIRIQILLSLQHSVERFISFCARTLISIGGNVGARKRNISWGCRKISSEKMRRPSNNKSY